MPRIDVVGLGPAGPELVTNETASLLAGAAPVIVRTQRHPASVLAEGAETLDALYESAETFAEVYASIVDHLVARAIEASVVVYAVPGSPVVAERTVQLLLAHPLVRTGELDVVVHAALSFVELAMTRLGVDPIAGGVRLVDGVEFAVEAAGERGPLLVAQCFDRAVLSEIKLSVETPPESEVVVLHHLGLPDERIFSVAWSELDRSFDPDHLTSLWIPQLAAPVASELVKLDVLVHRLRAECPWDQEQTHGSLSRHLLEETYEVLEALDAVDTLDRGVDVGGDPVGDLEEELGDLLFQIYFHAVLGAEAGRFTLADVAQGVHDKLEQRHPHVFGGDGAETAEEVAASWEVRKLAEKQRTSVTEGIPSALPALALMAKLVRKGAAVGIVPPAREALLDRGQALLSELAEGADAVVGDLLVWVVGVASAWGVDPEAALRARATQFRQEIEAVG